MKKVVYVHFRKKKVAEDGFPVDKERDANMVFRKLLDDDRALFEEKKYNLPRGPNCPKDEDIIALATEVGIIDDKGERGKTMATVFAHLEDCERCDALCRKAHLESKYSRDNHDAGSDGRATHPTGKAKPADPAYVDFKNKRKTESFVVKPKRDKNEMLRETRIEFRKFQADRKWEDPPGPNCPSDQEIRDAADYCGPTRSEQGLAMLRTFDHFNTCARCQAFYTKYVFDAICKHFADEEEKEKE